MQAICPYTRIHPRVRESLRSERLVFVHLGTDDSYWGLLSRLWARAEPFILVEHDIEVHPRALPELEACSEPWCLFPFSRLLPGPHSSWDGEGWSAGIPLLDKSLGCVRWSVELMTGEPDVMEVVGTMSCGGSPPKHWCRLDDAIAQVLERRGYHPHIHHPEVTHHHFLERWDRCSCGDASCRP